MYVTVEGVDGAGTTTLVEKLSEVYAGAVFTAEPDDTHFTGETVREALSRETAPVADALLFMADRAEHLEHTVKPALAQGRMVVSDRGHDSTYAYQGHRLAGRMVDPDGWFDTCYAPWNMEPDLTLFLDVSLSTAKERLAGSEDKYEGDEQLLLSAILNYRQMAEDNPHRFRRIDAEQSPDAVRERAVQIIRGERR
jgi:dTMP kinase